MDSGAEVWHLRAANAGEWEAWKNALERAAQHASKSAQRGSKNEADLGSERDVPNQAAFRSAEERGWQSVEALMGRISGIRDATRRLAQSAKQAERYLENGLGITTAVSAENLAGNFEDQ